LKVPMQKKTLEEQARDLGISVHTLKRRLKEEKDKRDVNKARNELNKLGQSEGWNPRSGNNKKR